MIGSRKSIQFAIDNHGNINVGTFFKDKAFTHELIGAFEDFIRVLWICKKSLFRRDSA
jgi:hypothetical protein